MPTFATEPILPDPPAGADVLHDREYRVRAFRLDDERILIQGAVHDQKPPGLYLEDDPDPLTIHHMQVSMEVAFPRLEITDVTVHFEAHPHGTCPTIVEHYGSLVGLSIARGFTHRIRELFGGPRGCTHTTALLQAMAPVAMQCFWSMRAAEAKLAGEPQSMFDRQRSDDTDDNMWHAIVNTCHVWDENGQAVAERRAGAPMGIPVFLRSRLEQLGMLGDEIDLEASE